MSGSVPSVGATARVEDQVGIATPQAKPAEGACRLRSIPLLVNWCTRKVGRLSARRTDGRWQAGLEGLRAVVACSLDTVEAQQLLDPLARWLGAEIAPLGGCKPG